MKLSRFFHFILLKDDVYAVYNSLIMDIIYVNSEFYNKIKNISGLTQKEIKYLKQKGIIIESDKQDDEALMAVRNRYEMVTGKVQIMYLILSSSCNLACKYCFIENNCFNNKKEITMSKDTARNAVRKYASYLSDNNISEGLIILYGGEPLVNWDVIKDAILYAKTFDVKIKFSMVTNATLLDLAKIKFLAENDVEVGISIDGPKFLNDKNRIYKTGNSSVYDQVIEKFPKLDMQRCKYGLSITVSEDFLNHQDEVLAWLKELGVHSIFYNLYHFTTYSDTWEDYYIRASEFLLKSYETLVPYQVYDGRINRKLDSVVDNEFKFADCGAIGGNQITIKPNGDVCVCHGYFKTDKYVIGNINRDDIKDMINTSEVDFWKNRATLYNEECLSCDSLFICGGGCAVQAESLFGDRNKIDLPFCIHTKKSLEWVLGTCYDLMIKEENKEKEVV